MFILLQLESVIIRTGIRQLISQYFPEAICMQTQEKQHCHHICAAFAHEKEAIVICDSKHLDWLSFLPNQFQIAVIDQPKHHRYFNIYIPENEFRSSILQSLNGLKPALSLREQLSTRELEIAQFISKGFQNKRIAEQLFISEHTIRTHRKNIYKKLNVSSVSELKQALQVGL